MFATKFIRKSIGNIETFIQNNQNYNRKMFNLHNIARLNRLLELDPTISPIPTHTQKNQIQTRILKILYQGRFVDLTQFKFQQDLRKQWNLDQLSITALISSIQQQFSTIFDIHVYQDVKTLSDVVKLLEEDQKII